ncbi:hypothetical protein K501DRAFT_213006 [Backusella circina FSU 941]|nr:hypothetical protein K501DRAFT_213006 [Backusella circina FSU 941]
MTGFKKPQRRKPRKDNVPERSYSVEELVQQKKRRIERQENSVFLSQLFDKLEDDVQTQVEEDNNTTETEKNEFEPQQAKKEQIEKIELDDDFLLGTDTSDSESEQEEKLEIDKDKRKFLDDEIIEKIEHAVSVGKKQAQNTEWHIPFFKKQEISEPLSLYIDIAVGKKEDFISELSATSEGRKFLLSSDVIPCWYYNGWECPHHIYQWLFEIVATEDNKTTAKSALDLLYTLWFDSVSDMTEREEQYIKLSTFENTLEAYNRLISQRHMPLDQFGWMMEVFSYSIKKFPNHYTFPDKNRVLCLLLRISLDKLGVIVLQSVQKALDQCLSALDKSNWVEQMSEIVQTIVGLVPNTVNQVHLLDAVKPVSEHSRLFKRIMAIVFLEKALQQDMIQQERDYEKKNTIDNEKIMERAIEVFHYPGGLLKQDSIKDYEQYTIRISMLDVAIGTDKDEIDQYSKPLLQLSNELRLIGRKIGTGVGVLQKTMANETIQRLWGRLIYITGEQMSHEA